MKTMTIEAVGTTAGIDTALENLIADPTTRIKKFEFFGDGPYDHEVAIHCEISDEMAHKLNAFGVEMLSSSILGCISEN